MLFEFINGKLSPCSEAESCASILRGLVSYHERMTKGMCHSRDFYLEALLYAISLAEKETEREKAEGLDVKADLNEKVPPCLRDLLDCSREEEVRA